MPSVDVVLHLLEVRRRHQRAEVGIAGGRRADLQALHARDQLLDQRVGRLLADRHRHRHRHAALAGRAVAGADQRIDRLVHVGVGHDDHVVLGAAEALHALARRAAARIDVLGDRRRADEADGLDVGMVEDGVDRFLVAVDDVEDAGRQARLHHQLAPASAARRGRAPTASG